MSKTGFTTNSAETVKLWNEKLFRDTVKASYFSRFMGTGSDSIVQVKTDLESGKGDRVRFAIEGLPDEFRTPVIMADIEDKSYKEIADAMGCPLGTVMSRLYRGRKLLRKELGEYAASRGLGKKNANS